MKSISLIDLIIIIVVLGILAGIAVPRYEQITEAKRESECRSGLGALRSGVTIFYANQAVETGTATWPTLAQICLPDTAVIRVVPKNPYQQADCAPDSIVTDTIPGKIVGTRGGWVYNPKTGQIWPNTSVVGENLW